ncbi:MAG: NAD(P)-binding protein [Clostridiales Family XIII bacterium]|nr:NAD(P)-binding protein [Clostridiales Family XIII bacterium]
MLKEKLHIQQECLETEPPFCTAACPFGLDVLDFTAKIAQGNFTAAYRAFRDKVNFPDIVSRLCGAPCRPVCPRTELDEAVRLPALERAVVAFTDRRAPNKYNVPKKKQRIAIIGAGPCGLSCALRFASNNYDVTIFEKEGRIGGRLWELLPREIFLRDIERSFANVRYELKAHVEIKSLFEIDADAVLIATGREGDSFGMRPGTAGFAPSEAPGVFLGGMLCGTDPAGAIADGMKAFTFIERYLKTAVMRKAPKAAKTKARIDPTRSDRAPCFPPAHEDLSREDAVSEAKRCLRCVCDACKLRCDFMRYYKKTPPRIAEDIYCTIHPGGLFGGDTFAKRMTGSCNLCGACKDACPRGLDPCGFIRNGRQALQRAKKWSWAYHDFWISDMRHAMGAHARERKFAPGRSACAFVFFPGCQLGASNPEYVLESYSWLLEKNPDTALWLSCCGAPAFWAGREDESRVALESLHGDWMALGKPAVITACPTCTKMFAQWIPSMKTFSLLSMMADAGFRPRRAATGEACAIFAPCAARNDDSLRRAVRALAKNAGYAIEEPSQAKDASGCCSWGGHISIANPDFANFQIGRRIARSPLPYIAYCSNCRDIFAGAGKPCLHILDVLFDLGEADRMAPGQSDRRRNRERLKTLALRGFWGEGGSDSPHGDDALILSDALRARISNDHILEEDVREVVLFCERGGRTVLFPETGEKCGFHMIGNLTLWVRYASENGRFRVTGVYGHRMRIVPEEMWNGRKVDPDL